MFPVLFESQNFTVFSYPLLMGIGWGVAYQIFFSLWPSEMSRTKGQWLFWGSFIAAWIGAKLLFILTVPSESIGLIREVSFWTGGGFVFYGGLLGGFAFLGVYKLFDHRFGTREIWPMLPALVFGHAIGRIGCFLAGCCYGAPTDFFWGVHLHGNFRHPTQLLEASGLLLIGTFLLRSRSSKTKRISLYFMYYGMLRFFVETLRGDLIRGSWGFLTPSQWISIGLIFMGICFGFINKNKRLRLAKLF